MTEKRFIGRYAGRTTKRLIGIEDIETNRVCVTIEENIRLLNELSEENKQLKTQIKIFEKFLDENNLDIDWEPFCTVDECKKDSDDYGCKECKYLGVM